jgi:tetratricopeptide (TPR) repeat protein
MDVGQIETKLVRRSHSPLFARLADEYVKAGKLAEARELCLSGLQKYPSYSTAHIVLARCYFAEKNYSATLEEAQQALVVYPDSGAIKELIQKCLDAINPPVVIPQPPPAPEPMKEEAQEFVGEEQAFQDTAADTGDNDEANESKSEEIPSMQFEEPVGETLTENMPAPIEHNTDSNEELRESNLAGDEIQTSEADVIDVERQAVEEFKVEAKQTSVAESPIDADENRFPEPVEEMEVISDVNREPEMLVEEPEQVNIPETPAAPKEEPVLQERSAFVETKEPELPPAIQKPEPVEEEIEEPADGRIVSQTLAEIYAKQGVYDEAIVTYKLLKRRRPQHAAEFDARISELEMKLRANQEEENK